MLFIERLRSQCVCLYDFCNSANRVRCTIYKWCAKHRNPLFFMPTMLTTVLTF